MLSELKDNTNKYLNEIRETIHEQKNINTKTEISIKGKQTLELKNTTLN